MNQKDETKFAGGQLLSATEFGKLVGCTLNGVKKMMEGKNPKLTEGFSYMRDKNSIVIDVDKAKQELRNNTKPATCKNEKLLEFLELDQAEAEKISDRNDKVSAMGPAQVREELNKSELRLSWIQEKVMEGKWADRAVMEKNMEAAAIEIRDKLTGLSAKITPRILAKAHVPAEAEDILYKAIEEILFDISKLAEKDITAEK